MSSKTIMLSAAGAALLVTAGQAAASSGPLCVRYANKAVSQQALNLRKGCGFAGPRWHTWWDGHYAWCLHQSPARLSQENSRRSHKLSLCLS